LFDKDEPKIGKKYQSKCQEILREVNMIVLLVIIFIFNPMVRLWRVPVRSIMRSMSRRKGEYEN